MLRHGTDPSADGIVMTLAQCEKYLDPGEDGDPVGASGAGRPTTGRRLEDGRPEGQNLAQPGFGSRQPYVEGGKPKTEAMRIAIDYKIGRSPNVSQSRLCIILKQALENVLLASKRTELR